MTDRPLTPRERRRNARELERRMAELDRLDAAYGLGALPQAGRPRSRPRRQRRSTTPIAVAATAALMAAAVLFLPSSQMEAARRALGLGPDRLLSAPSADQTGGAFTFAMTQPGSDKPVGWDPCRPIRYRVNPSGEPEGGAELVERAIARASAATGLSFEDAGETDQRPFTEEFVPIGTDRPVVVGWGSDEEFPELAGDVVGIGGGAAERGVRGRTYFVTGAVALDTEAFTADAVADAPEVMESIVLHEVAHVLGLGHVDDPTELMAERNSGQTDLGPGDREGLARLGSIPCA